MLTKTFFSHEIGGSVVVKETNKKYVTGTNCTRCDKLWTDVYSKAYSGLWTTSLFAVRITYERMLTVYNNSQRLLLTLDEEDFSRLNKSLRCTKNCISRGKR
uniref:Uncharacterized protein n=1 Tax=Wuchereria bancrofti TaxID=6293 RepID=A0AAF5RVH0_WUCBA